MKQTFSEKTMFAIQGALRSLSDRTSLQGWVDHGVKVAHFNGSRLNSMYPSRSEWTVEWEEVKTPEYLGEIALRLWERETLFILRNFESLRGGLIKTYDQLNPECERLEMVLPREIVNPIINRLPWFIRPDWIREHKVTRVILYRPAACGWFWNGYQWRPVLFPTPGVLQLPPSELEWYLRPTSNPTAFPGGWDLVAHGHGRSYVMYTCDHEDIEWLAEQWVAQEEEG